MRRSHRRLLLIALGTSICCLLLVLIVKKKSGSDSDISYQDPRNCNCPTSNRGAPRSGLVPISPISVNPNRFNSCKDIDSSAPVQRAIVIYYPSHQFEYFFPEVRWLYRSWKEMLLSQPKNWRTDFVIFTYSYSKEFHSLACVNRIRENKEEPSMCRLFFYVPIQFRTGKVIANNYLNAFDDAKRSLKSHSQGNDPFIGVPNVNDPEVYDAKRSESLYVNLRHYGYTDSINSIYEGYPTFKMYDFILRTDIDVFIYRHFSNYIPQNCSFITGGGGYGTDFNRRKLSRIARDMGFSHANISGMGSTWYGTPYDSFLVANQTLHGMLWLTLYEFAGPERESKLGTMMWPEWHYGVLLLYGQHLGLNHLVAQNEVRVIVGHNLLDQSTTDNNIGYVQNGIRLNLHCWHTSERFSKFAFKLGQYNRSELELYRNDTTVRDYAMRMALESKYMTLEELAAYGSTTVASPK